MNRTISIGCDHAGFAYKDAIIDYLENNNYQVIDNGTFGTQSVDYPHFAHLVAKDVSSEKAHRGIVLCGTGNGVAMSTNKHRNIRAALCWSNEIVALSRKHNDANILALPARFISEYFAISMVKTFLNTPFEEGRHARRKEKISNC